jgi:hypothetical protein
MACSPKDELAASILGHPVLMSSFLAASREELETSAATDCTGVQPGEASIDPEVVAAGDMAAITHSISTTAGEAAAAPVATPQASSLVATNPVCPDEMVTGWGLLTGELADLGSKAALSIEGFKDWIMESLAALVEVGCCAFSML